MATIPSEVEIENIGPVEHVSIPLQAGKITVLRARNGKGKTRALEAIASGAGHKGKLDVRDGALSGSVTFGDELTLRVGRSTTRKGELVVNTLEGKFRPGDIVDPGFKSPEAADAKRQKALLQLAMKEKPTAELFYGIVGGKEAFERYVSPRATETDDVITMADRIKRDLEAGARKSEEKAEHAAGHARGSNEAAESIDVKQPDDTETLQAALEDAIRAESKLTEQKHAEKQDRDRRQAAADALEDAEMSYKGLTVEVANAYVRKATEEVAATTTAVHDAETALAKAQEEAKLASRELRSATKELQAAQNHEKTVKAWREQLEADRLEPVDAMKLENAKADVIAAREAVETGALVRQAKIAIARSLQFDEQAKQHRKAAELLRHAAKGTDEVLSGIVASLGCPLRVEAGRLVTDTHRGDTYFGDLSHGERWKLVLDIAIEAVGENGLLPIEQEAWEGLDPSNREALAEHVASSTVAFVTAEATDDEELKAELFDGA